MDRAIFVVVFILGLCALLSLVPAWLLMLLLGALGWTWSYWFTLVVVMLLPLSVLRIHMDY